MRRNKLYNEEEVMAIANRIARRKVLALAIGGTCLALGAIAAITAHAVKNISTDKSWSQVDWNLDDDYTLL